EGLSGGQRASLSSGLASARAPQYGHRDAIFGRQRDPAQDHWIRALVDGCEVDARYHGAQDLGHLGVSQRGADAAPDPAPEGQPRVRLDAFLEEPLGPELECALV